MPALHEGVVDVLLAHLLCHQGQAPVVCGIFQGNGCGFGHLVARYPAFLQHIRYAALFLVRGRSDHRIQSPFGIKALEAFQIGVGYHRNGTVSRHLVGFTSHQRPDGQFPLLVVDAQHGVHHIGNQLWLDDGEQRMQRTVGIPQREGRIVGPAVGLVNLVVVSAEFPVHVGIQRWGDEHVVQAGIENLLTPLVTALHVDARQHLVPAFLRIGTHLFKVPSGLLGFQIGQRVGTAHGRQGHLELHVLRIVLEGKHPFHGLARQRVLAGRRIVVEYGYTLDGLFGFQHEEHLVLRAPSPGEAVALHRIFVHTLQAGFKGTVAVALFQVHQQARCFFGIGIAMDGHTVGSRQLGTYAVVHQQRIVAGSHLLVLV